MSDGKTIDKGFVISPTLAGIFLVAFLGILGYGYKSSTADSRETRDAVIRMETMLDERTATFKERQAEERQRLDNEISMAQIRREQESKDKNKLLAKLREKGIVIDD